MNPADRKRMTTAHPDQPLIDAESVALLRKTSAPNITGLIKSLEHAQSAPSWKEDIRQIAHELMELTAGPLREWGVLIKHVPKDGMDQYVFDIGHFTKALNGSPQSYQWCRNMISLHQGQSWNVPIEYKILPFDEVMEIHTAYYARVQEITGPSNAG